MTKVKLSVAERIDRARDGRSQKWIVIKMNQQGIKITDVQFSRKKNEEDGFTAKEKEALNLIIGTDFK